MSTREEETPSERPGKRQKVGSYTLHYVRARSQFVVLMIAVFHLTIYPGPDQLIDRLPSSTCLDLSGTVFREEANTFASFSSTQELPTMRSRIILP